MTTSTESSARATDHADLKDIQAFIWCGVTDLLYVCVQAASVDSIQAAATAPAANASSFEHHRRRVHQERVSSTQGGGS